MAPHLNPLVRKLQHLHPLTDKELQVLECACRRVIAFAADEDIVREGDRPGDCNLLLEGVVFRYKDVEAGKRQILSFQFPGDIFDAQSFVLHVMDHSIAALTACKVALIPHQTILDITEGFPRIARALWKDTLVDASVFRQWMTSIGRRTAVQRIAHLVCEVFVRLETVGLAQPGRVDWPFTQVELGDALGLSVVHINRSLQRLRQAGLISVKNGVMAIHDWEGLKAAADFDPGYLHLTPSG